MKYQQAEEKFNSKYLPKKDYHYYSHFMNFHKKGERKKLFKCTCITKSSKHSNIYNKIMTMIMMIMINSSQFS